MRPRSAEVSKIRQLVEDYARRAGIAKADDFARKWHILMKGSIVAAGEGDTAAARRARDVGQVLLSQHLPS